MRASPYQSVVAIAIAACIRASGRCSGSARSSGLNSGLPGRPRSETDRSACPRIRRTDLAYGSRGQVCSANWAATRWPAPRRRLLQIIQHGARTGKIFAAGFAIFIPLIVRAGERDVSAGDVIVEIMLHRADERHMLLAWRSAATFHPAASRARWSRSCRRGRESVRWLAALDRRDRCGSARLGIGGRCNASSGSPGRIGSRRSAACAASRRPMPAMIVRPPYGQVISRRSRQRRSGSKTYQSFFAKLGGTSRWDGYC